MLPKSCPAPRGRAVRAPLEARVESFVRSGAAEAVVVDPAGTWRGRGLPPGIVLFDAKASGASTLAALSILLRTAPCGMLAIDDCEMIPATAREWRSFHAVARATGTRLVLVVPEGASGIADAGRTPSPLHAFGRPGFGRA